MNVQLEHGYTKIANEILDALCKYHPGFTEGQVLWVVIRKTYGWNKKSDKISISQLVKSTGKSKRMVIYAVQNLEAKKMITVTRDFKQTNDISFNKDYSLWLHEAKSEQYEKLHLVQKVAPSATNGKNLVQHSVNNLPKVAHTKETSTKEIIQKKEYIAIHDLNDSHFQEIADRYGVPLSFVVSKYDDMVNWHESTGKTKKDWIATLRNFVKKDALSIRKEASGKSKIAFIA